MNKNHLKWARSHDWGENAELNGGEISFEEFVYSVKAGKSISLGTIKFTNFQSLRDWAGY